MKKEKIRLLKLASQLIYMTTINVKKNPEYLSKNGKYCHNNFLVASCVSDINKLIKNIKVSKV